MRQLWYLWRLFTCFAVVVCTPVSNAADKRSTTVGTGVGINVPLIRDQLVQPPLTLEDYSKVLADFRAGLVRNMRDDVGRIIVTGLVDLGGQALFLSCLGAERGRFQNITDRLESSYLTTPDGRRPGNRLSSVTPRPPVNDVFSAPETAEALSYVELASRACGNAGFGEEGEDSFHLEPPVRPADGGIASPEDVANYTQCLEVRATWAQEQCGGPAAVSDGGGAGGQTARKQDVDLLTTIGLWTLKKVVNVGIGAALPDINPHDKVTDPSDWAKWEREHQEERVTFQNGLEEIAVAIAKAIFEWFFGANDQEECAPGYEFAVTHPLAGATYELEGTSLGPSEMLLGCVCHLSVTHLGESNPDAPWDCKSAAEQRRDCARNPYTPDDAPRTECIEFLYDDANASPPTGCVSALCPSNYDIDNPDLCTCRLSPGQSNAPPDSLPVNPNACAEVVCSDGANAVPTAGGCFCQVDTRLPERLIRERPREPIRNPGGR